MSTNTLFLRLEGPMQAWGNQESKFVIRRTAKAPTKSGVIGLLCAALGVSRSAAPLVWLPRLCTLQMGVRIDAPGIRWWDYHTVGADMEMRIAEGEGKTKPGALLSRREYLCDSSFLVALRGDAALVDEVVKALREPKWTPYLGRKCCPPSRPLLENAAAEHADLHSALQSVPWRRRFKDDEAPEQIECLLEWTRSSAQAEAPADAQIWYDVPLTLEPPSHRPRFVTVERLQVGVSHGVPVSDDAAQRETPAPPRARADYGNSEYRKRREERLTKDRFLCVFCKARATTVQHVTYRHAGGDERIDELRSLCRLCHDAVTMIEYGFGMGMDRINPEDPSWREMILSKRTEIVRYRSLETRRRRFSSKEDE